MDNFEVIIGFPPNREKLVAEIWQSDQMIAEINQEAENLKIELYFIKTKMLELDYNAFMNILMKAKEKLLLL